MKLIYVKEGETLVLNEQKAVVPESGSLAVNDEVRQFDKAGNEIVMYVKL